MKTLNLRLISLCLLMPFCAINCLGQNGGQSGQRIKLEKEGIPSEVTEKFSKDFPMASHEDWYPAILDESDWYGYEPDFYNLKNKNKPGYFVAEFNNDKILEHAVYSRTGDKMAVHRKSNSDVPKAVSTAIRNGTYKDWILGEEKEEIFKDSENDQLKVYRVEVKNRGADHILFFQGSGKLLKDIEIKLLPASAKP